MHPPDKDSTAFPIIDEVCNAVRRFCAENDLFPAPGRVLAACSGGPDSVCLTDVLHRLADALSLELVVGHVDHRTRRETAREKAGVRKWAGVRGWPCVSATIDRPVSTETEARRERYLALERLAAQAGALYVATAHTADDQAETVIMRVIRGSGLRGLGGIPARRGRFVRPLLSVSRHQVEQYVEALDLPVVHDPSNSDRRFFRNRVRHDILPGLERENPQLKKALCRLSGTAVSHYQAFAEMTRRVLEPGWHKVEGDDGRQAVALAGALLRSLPEPCFWWALRSAHGVVGRTLNAGDPPPQLERRHGNMVWERWRAHCGPSGNMRRRFWRLDLPGGVAVAANGHALVVLPASWLQDPGDLEWCIPGPGIWPLEALDARLQVDGRLERAWFPLQVRNWRPGDRIATPAARHRKLQDVFVDRRVERPLRRRFPLLVLDPAQTGRQVFWIGGPQVGGSGLGAPSTPVLRQTLQVNFAPNASSGLLLELLNAPKAVSSA